MQALRICILAALAAATLAASSSIKSKKIHKTPRLQRRLGLARIELPEPRLKHLAHRLLEAKRGFLSAQVTANDGHLVGLSVKMKHGGKPGYHVSVGQGYSKKGWHAPPDLDHVGHTSLSSGPYSGGSFQSLFRGSEGLSFGDASSSLLSEGQPYYYKDTASLSGLYPFTSYQVPGYVTAVPKYQVTKLVDTVPSVLPAVSAEYDQASLVATPLHTSTVLQGLQLAKIKALDGHASAGLGTKLPATRIVHKVPLSVLPKKAAFVQQFPATLHGAHAKLFSPAVYAAAKVNYPAMLNNGGHHVLSLQKLPVSKLAAHLPQSHYVMHTVKPVSSAIGVIRTPIYAATGSGELYPVDVDGGALQEDYAVGADGLQSGHANAFGGVGGQASAGYGNGDVEGLQYGGPQGGQLNGGGGGKYGNGKGAAGGAENGVFQSGQFNGGGGRKYDHGNGAAGGADSGGFQGGQSNGGGGGKYGHGNGAAGGFDNGGFQGGQFNGGAGGKYGHGNGAAGGADSGGFQGGQFNGGGGGKYGHGNGAAGGFDNGGFQGGQFHGGGGGKYGHGNGAAGGADSAGFQGGQFNGGGGGKYGNGNGAAGGVDNEGFQGGQFNGGGGKYGHGNGAAGGVDNGGYQEGGQLNGDGGNYAHGNGAAGGFSNGGFNGGGGGKFAHGNSAERGLSNGGYQGGGGGGGGGKYGFGNGAAGGIGNGGLQGGHFNGGGGNYGQVNGFQQGFGNGGEGSQEVYPNKKGHGGTDAYGNGGGPQGFPPGLGYQGNSNGGGLAHKNYGNAGAGPQAGFANGEHQGGNGFTGGAQSGYANGGAASNGFINGGFQGPHPGGGRPQQHAFPHGVTGFNVVPGGLSAKHGLKGALPAELTYGGVPVGGLQVQTVQAHPFPDIPGPEESVARGQFNGKARGSANGRAKSGGVAEEGELQGGASGEGFSAVTQVNGDYKNPQGALSGYDVKGEGAAGGQHRTLGKQNGEAGYKNGGGWKPIVDSRYEAKFSGGSLNAGKFDGNQQGPSFGGNGFRKLYGGAPANGHAFINNGEGDGLVNGDLQGKGSHVQYPKYRHNREKFFGGGNSQANGGKAKFLGGSGSGFSRQFNMNGNGGEDQNFGNVENGDIPANVPSKEFNGRGSNARFDNDFGNGGGFPNGAQGPGYFETNGNRGMLAQGKFHNGGDGGQPAFVQSEGFQGNGGSGAGEFLKASQGGRSRFHSSGNGRNFGQAVPNGRLRGEANGGGPTPPKFCPKGGWKPIIKKEKGGNVNDEEGAMRGFPDGQGNGFNSQSGFEALGRPAQGEGMMGNAGVNGFEGGDVYQGQAPREYGGGSGTFSRGPVNQFNGGELSEMRGQVGNGGAAAGYSNGRMNGFASEGSFGPQSQINNGGPRDVRYGNGQGAAYGGAPRQFLNGGANGASFSQAGVDYEGEELPGEESFKREEVKKVFFRPVSTQTKKVPKSVIVSDRATSSRSNKKSPSPKRTSVKSNPFVGLSQLITIKEPPNLEQLLATYKIDGQNLPPLELRSLRGHGYSDVSLEDHASAPVFQKASPAAQLELATPTGGDLVTPETKAHSMGELKKTVSVDSLGSLSSAEQSSEEHERENTSPLVPKSQPSTEASLAVKELSASGPSEGESESSAGVPPTTLKGSSSEEIVEPIEKASPSDSLGGSLEKSSLYDTREGHVLPYGRRRSPTYYKQDRISSSYLIPVRVPPSLRSKIRRSG